MVLKLMMPNKERVIANYFAIFSINCRALAELEMSLLARTHVCVRSCRTAPSIDYFKQLLLFIQSK
jgi:hypothetical protein